MRGWRDEMTCCLWCPGRRDADRERMTYLTNQPPLRSTAWILASTPVAFAAVVALGVATFVSSGVDDTAFMTPAQLDTIRPLWLLFWTAYAGAVLLGAAGTARLNASLDSRVAMASQVAAAVSAVAILGNLVLNLAMAGSTAERLELNAAYEPSLLLSMIAIWAAAASATLTGLALRVTGVLRRTGTAAAIFAVAFVLVDVAVTRGELPPFVVSLPWAMIGIALLLRRVRSAE